MRLGVVIPQTEIGADPGAVRDYAQAAELLGHQHLVVIEHVLGAEAANHAGWGPYTHTDLFHEPFVVLGYLAGFTESIEPTTGRGVLGQRWTTLGAKQAAQGVPAEKSESPVWPDVRFYSKPYTLAAFPPAILAFSSSVQSTRISSRICRLLGKVDSGWG